MADELPYKLYTQTGCKNFYVSFWIDGIHIRKTTKTDDRDLANRKAIKIYYEAIVKNEQGLDIKPKNLKHICQEYIKANVSKNTTINFFENFFIKYFGKKYPSDLHLKSANDFMMWRKTYWTEGPGKDITEIKTTRHGKPLVMKFPESRKKEPLDSTIKAETIAINKFIRFLHDSNYIKKPFEIGRMFSNARAENKRPGFSQGEIDKVGKLIIDRLVAQTHPAKKKAYAQFQAFFEFMISTGCRPPEAANLRWSDALGYVHGEVPEKSKIMLRIHGKSKSREMVPLPSVQHALDLAYDSYYPETPTQDDYIFKTESGGKRTGMFPDYFNEILEELNLKKDYRGENRTTYSLRHYFITMMLSKNVNSYVLAKNLGTSVEMLEKFYDHNSNEKYKDILIPTTYKV